MYKDSHSRIFWGNEDKPSYKVTIEKSNRLINETEKKIEDLKYTLSLYKADRVRTVIDSVDYYEIVGMGNNEYGNYYVNKAKEWLKISKEKYDKRKKYYEKDCFESLQNKISKHLFYNNKVEIMDISQSGWEGYCDIVTLKCNELVFEVFIPNFNRITINNFDLAEQGRLTIYVRDGKNSILYLVSNYDENIINEEMKKFFENKERIEEIKKNLETA